jgi:hypothetical protein
VSKFSKKIYYLHGFATYFSGRTQKHLMKFEVLLLNPDQVEEFNVKVSSGLMDSGEPLYQAWLHLKLPTQPTESEAILQVLGIHTASNIPKRDRKRNAVVPDGPSRYDPSSQQWKTEKTRMSVSQRNLNPLSLKFSQSKPQFPNQKENRRSLPRKM